MSLSDDAVIDDEDDDVSDDEGVAFVDNSNRIGVVVR